LDIRPLEKEDIFPPNIVRLSFLLEALAEDHLERSYGAQYFAL
jgi:hypothetical protein